MNSIVSDLTGVCDQPLCDAAEINYKLKRLGWSQAKLASALKVSPGVVNNVIHGRGTSYVIARCIAEMLNVSVHELWPERYVFKARPSRCKILNNNQGEKP
ncbi:MULTISPECIES: helix-turn-helix domain-containing protein [Deefgea]|uniref:Helix-turn-helix domain-containing protein n=1 Tax=Deefgea chitinilytica TaxID=570276 RepID=A0ABS2CAP9_9NEIS|nr:MULTISPECIES: helix-turn-helix transcriptional regulator [Deefgea]MBM5571102.1 helix-turn-helix domain-containing protein [Deefgea chitinilytica]MBM9888332.1 helix-turn-helix transcriptional regulator [Deefgea sp. CFH1-16]